MDATTKVDQHTQPWTDDEYILVNGRRFIYTRAVTDYQSDVVVRFPGGASELASVLRERGVRVQMPARMRARQ